MDEAQRAREREVLERVARAICRRGMCVPAIFFFESIMPLSFLAGQALVFLQPMISVLVNAPDYDVFAEAIEDRDNLRWFVDRLEELNDDAQDDEEPPADRG